LFFEEFVYGTSPKKFSQCRGSYLMDMFREIRNDPDSRYVTCVDRLIADETFTEEKFKDFPVSVILKTHKNEFKEEFTTNELIGSRIANLFGIATEYVAPIKDNPDKYLVVDFLTGNQQIETFCQFLNTIKLDAYHFDISRKGDCCIKHYIEPLIKAVMNFYKNKSAYARAIKLKQILIDFTTQYFFKKYIIHDADLCGVNFAVVYSSRNTNLRVSPAYDFEKCFFPGRRTLQGYGMEEDLKYLTNSYPALVRSLLKTFTLTPEKRDKMQDIFNEFEPYRAYRESHYNLIVNSITALRGNADIAFKHNESLKAMKQQKTEDNEHVI